MNRWRASAIGILLILNPGCSYERDCWNVFLTFEGDGSGSISPAELSDRCTSGSVGGSGGESRTLSIDGEKATSDIIAVPDADSVFIGWSGACAGTGACTLGFTGDTDVTATFAKATNSVLSEVDGGGNVVLAAAFAGTVDIGDSAPLTSAVSYDLYVARYAAASGLLDWSRRIGGTGREILLDMELESATGDIVITGYFQETVDFGAGNVTSSDGYDLFIARYASASGALVWVQTFPGTTAP